MKTILLTGGSGFIGKNLRESFLSHKYHILAPSHNELDLTDESSVNNFFKKHAIDIIIHAAVKPGHRNAVDLNNLFYTNTRMFFNLECHCNEVEKMIVIGSGAIYDNRYYHPKMTEDEWIKHIPADDHGYCKYVCEKIIQNSTNIYDLRVFGIFGKYEDYSIRFVSNAICKAIYNLPITIKQNRFFDYIFVEDLPAILDWFIENKPQYHSYNITPDESVSLLKLAQIVQANSGKNLPIKIGQDGFGLEYSGSNKLIKREMPMFSLQPIEEAIKKLHSWYQENIDYIDKEKLLFDK